MLIFERTFRVRTVPAPVGDRDVRWSHGGLEVPELNVTLRTII